MGDVGKLPHDGREESCKEPQMASFPALALALFTQLPGIGYNTHELQPDRADPALHLALPGT